MKKILYIPHVEIIMRLTSPRLEWLGYTMAFMLLSTLNILAQSISGPVSATRGQAAIYQYTAPHNDPFIQWQTSHSGITVTNVSGDKRTATISFSSTLPSGNYKIKVIDHSYGLMTPLTTEYSVGVGVAPPIPNAHIQLNRTSCFAGTLTYTNAPPAGITWYWQTTASGTSTAQAGNTWAISETTPGTYYYYLRAKEGAQWSSSVQSFAVTHQTPLVPPHIQAVQRYDQATETYYVQACQGNSLDLATLATNSSPLSGGTDLPGEIRWYESGGTTALTNLQTPTLAPGQTKAYEVANYNTNAQCVGNRRKVVIEYTAPPLSGAVIKRTLIGGNGTLQVDVTADVIAWYADAATTQLLVTGNTLTINGLTATNKTYYLKTAFEQGSIFGENNSCSSISPVEVTNYDYPRPTITYHATFSNLDQFDGFVASITNTDAYNNAHQVNYQWYKNNSPISGAMTAQYTITTPGHYTVEVIITPVSGSASGNTHSLAVTPYSDHSNAIHLLTPHLANPSTSVQSSGEGCGQRILTLVDEFPALKPINTSDDIIWYWQTQASQVSKDYPAFGRNQQGQIITNSNGLPIGQPFRITQNESVYLKAYDPINQVWSSAFQIGDFSVMGTPSIPVFGAVTAYCQGDEAYLSVINAQDYEVEWYLGHQIEQGQVKTGEQPLQVGATLVQTNIQQSTTYWARFKVAYPGSGNTCYSGLVSREVAVRTDCNDRYNYVTTHSVRKKGVISLTEVDALQVLNEEVLRSTGYFDGLGRQSQQVGHQSSPAAKDVVLPIAYDGFGRMSKEYLPYTMANTGQTGGFRAAALNEQASFYQNATHLAHSQYAYSLQQYEASPLNRVNKMFAPGENWVGSNKGSDTTNLVNPDPNSSSTSTLNKIRHLKANLNNLVVSHYYAKGELILRRTIDEDGKVQEEYMDKLGQVMLKRAKPEANIWAETYYVYDDLGRMSFVLPPEATKLLKQNNWSLDAATLTKLTRLWFHYRYDARGRMVEKYIPGAGKTEMVYDTRDRLVLAQDAKQRTRQEWIFTKYDYLNRPVMQGLYTNASNRATLQANLDAHFGQVGYQAFEQFDPNQTNHHYYTNQAFPNSQLDVLSVTYYDNYTWKNGNTAYDYQATYQALVTDPVSNEVTGQITATKIKILDSQVSQAKYLTTVSYYDDRQRIIQTIADNHQDGKDVTMTQYAFDGRVLQTVTKHAIAHPARTYHIYQWSEYDHTTRVKATYQEVTESATFIYKDLATAKTTPSVEKLSKLAYNELGQVLSKKLGEKTSNPQQPLQTLNYHYNIRGWMTHLNDAGLSTQNTDGDIFGFELKYAQGGVHAYLNGNIAQMVWQSSLDGIQRQYDYTYDGLNRLTSADYSDNDTPTTGSAKPNFDVQNISYDLNGNILTLKRYGLQKQTVDLQKTFGVIDQLAYSYQGNQLLGVDDATNPAIVTGVAKDFRDGHKYTTQGQEYFYDANGNLTQDKNKNIESIAYNHLNLPTEIIFTGNRSIRYVYDAAGIKLQKVVNDAGVLTTTDYIGEFIYENDELQFLHSNEGRILAPGQLGDNADFVYEYHYKDHLGNLRVAFREGTASTTQATLEDRTVDLQQGFTYEPEVRATKPTGGGHAAKLGKETQLLGPWKTLKVTKGDQVSAEVYVHINGTPSQGNALPIQVFVANLANVYNQNGETSINNPNLLQLGVSFSPNGQSNQSPGLPVAYLRYVFYNEEGAAVKSGRFFVSTLAQGGWERLLFDLKVPENGTLQIYTANETENQNVWFDDLKVTFTPQLIVQENHYYPFGMNLAGIEKQGRPDHQFQYNGKEFEEETNWIEFEARMHDPQLGRFHSIDPKTEEFNFQSPYVYAANNPVRFIDIRGEKPGDSKNGTINSFIIDITIYEERIDWDALLAMVKGKNGSLAIKIASGSKLPTKNVAVKKTSIIVEFTANKEGFQEINQIYEDKGNLERGVGVSLDITVEQKEASSAANVSNYNDNKWPGGTVREDNLSLYFNLSDNRTEESSVGLSYSIISSGTAKSTTKQGLSKDFLKFNFVQKKNEGISSISLIRQSAIFKGAPKHLSNGTYFVSFETRKNE